MSKNIIFLNRQFNIGNDKRLNQNYVYDQIIMAEKSSDKKSHRIIKVWEKKLGVDSSAVEKQLGNFKRVDVEDVIGCADIKVIYKEISRKEAMARII